MQKKKKPINHPLLGGDVVEHIKSEKPKEKESKKLLDKAQKDFEKRQKKLNRFL